MLTAAVGGAKNADRPLDQSREAHHSACPLHVSDDLGAELGRVVADKAQHQRLWLGLELAVPSQRVRPTGVVGILVAHRLGVGPGQGDLRWVLEKQPWRADGGEVRAAGDAAAR